MMGDILSVRMIRPFKSDNAMKHYWFSGTIDK